MSVPPILKPKLNLGTENQNVQTLSIMVAMSLKRHGLDEYVPEMYFRATSSTSYEAAKGIFQDYVNASY